MNDIIPHQPQNTVPATELGSHPLCGSWEDFVIALQSQPLMGRRILRALEYEEIASFDELRRSNPWQMAGENVGVKSIALLVAVAEKFGVSFPKSVTHRFGKLPCVTIDIPEAACGVEFDY